MKISHLSFAAFSIAALFTPSLLTAHAKGPDPRHTGAPGDDPLACTTSGCHVGVPLNSGGGNVQIQFPGDQTYTPGQQQTLTVVVTDPNARTVYKGFQLTARLASDPANGQAGDFTSGPGEVVICDDAQVKGPNGCSASAPVQFIEHDNPGNGTWSVSWTPPSSDVGDVYLYIAGNANTVNDVPDGGHIYTAHYKLTVAGSGGSKPTITAANVAVNFNSKASVAPGTWLEIYGSNLATTARNWGSPDFDGSNAPTALNRVTVTVNGKPAYLDYVSSGQVNVQAPENSATGPVQLVVTNAAGSSAPVTVQAAAVAPALLAPGAWNVGGKQYAVATFTTEPGTYVGKAALISGLSFRTAKAGDLITLYGIGFGPVTPSTPAGTVAPQTSTLVTKPNILFGQTPGDLSCTNGCYYGLAPFAVGLYQFNVRVPTGATGDVALNVDVGGVSTNQNLFITLQ